MTAEWFTAPANFSIPEQWKLPDEDRDFIREATWSMILSGNDETYYYCDRFAEQLESAGVEDEEAERFFASVLDLRRAQQVALGGPPSSALTMAFQELATVGVVARENFSCCGNCGSSEIGDERDASRTWLGYVFYHGQDTENILENHETFLGYGAFLDAYLPQHEWEALSERDKGQRYAAITGALMVETVIPILEKHGITVTWNRDLGTRIRLSGVDFYATV